MLVTSWRLAALGKQGAAPVARFSFAVGEQLLALQQRLRSGTWQPGAYTHFTILEPKRRRISAAPFADRVVHHALCRVLEPRFEPNFCPYSYANRVGLGTHRAVARAQQLARRHTWVLRLDVQRHFPSIDHAVLRALLWRRVSEPGLRELINRILASGDGQHDPEAASPALFEGDDLLAFLGQHLRLRVHENAAQVQPCALGIPWLGFVLYPQHGRVKARKVVQATRRLKARHAAWRAGELGFDAFDASVQGWINHVRHADTWGLREHVLGQLPLQGRPLR